MIGQYRVLQKAKVQQQIMSIFANDLGYDFSFLSHQGAYMSSTTFNCIQQYFQPIELPPHSAYHLIGMHNPQLMAKCRVEPILASFLKASENCRRNLIIDLSLPYHDDRCSNRTFQGRYIICNGVLLGVRLNTSVRKIGSAYSPWPRHRAKHVSLKIMGKESSFIIGEISLYLLNVRIGLLFQSQIDTSSQEYLNQGFDIIALTYESITISSQIIAKKNDLSRQTILLQSETGSFTKLITKQAIESMLYQTSIPLARQKNTIYVQYYDLNRVFISKNRHYVSQNEINFITPIQINLALTQKKIKIQNPQSSYKLQLQAYSLQKSHKKGENYHLNIFYQKLFLFSFRSCCQNLVIMLEDSPYTLCFLYLLESIMQQRTCKENLALSQKFKFIDLPTNNNKLFHKFKFLNMEKTWESIYENQSNTGHLVRTLDHISSLQRKQSYFILITADRQVKVVVEMLNNREIVKLQKGKSDQEVKSEDSSIQCLSKSNNALRTWITTNFFSDEELRKIYFSQQFISFFADQQQHSKIWKKHNNKSQNYPSLMDLSISRIQLSSIKNPQKIEGILLQNNHLQLQFQTHYSKVIKSNTEISKKQLFSHFLFRRATSIDFHNDQENQPNPLIQLLITDEQNIKRNFNFLTRRTLTTYQKLSERVKLNLIAAERVQSMKIKCHSCEGQFSYEVMYMCQFIECKESFCYQCLRRFNCFQERSMLKETDNHPKIIKLCPICKSLCRNCTKCEVKRIQLTKQSKKCVNSLHSQCHYCKQSQNLYSYQCSNPECKRYFCLNCIQQCYRVKTQQYQNSNWKCFVCQNRCYCNQCERQKAKMFALRDFSSETVIRQKKTNLTISRNNCSKKSIQVKDSDCEFIEEIDEITGRSTISIISKNQYENQSISTIYNEQTLYKSPSKSKRRKSKNEKPTPLVSPQVTQQQESSTRKRKHDSYKKVQVQHQSPPPPKKKIKTNPKMSSLK